jgi:transposase
MPGVCIEYLPPYSPDLNPIEEAFSKIKYWVHQHQEYYSTAGDDGIIYDMLEVLDIITPSDACNYFIHAGYF